MKILLDPQIFIQRYGGISRYYAEIWKFINNSGSDSEIISPMIFSDNLHLSEYHLQPQVIPASIEKIISNNKILKKGISGINVLLTIISIKRNNFDIFLPTYYYPYFLKYLKKPFVLTVYDMIHELYPKYFKGDVKVEHKKLLMEKATKIIAISENTKQDILRIYPHIEKSKIDVVYLAHSINLSAVNDKIGGLPEKYLLFIGNRKYYKNFSLFLESVKNLVKNDKNLFLVCGGGGKFDNEEKTMIAELGLSENIMQVDFRDNQLAYLYQHAIVFIFPSEYEGFGIPVLEAMACGCPVILTNRSSFPEVAGDAGIYFENNDSADLENKITQVLNDPEFRKSVVDKSLLRARQFSWDKTIENCMQVYQSVV